MRPVVYVNATDMSRSFTTHIAVSREAAIRDVERFASKGVCIFSDGSGYKEGAGASAVCRMADGVVHIRRVYLGPLATHTVYEGEVVGLSLAVDIASRLPACR